MRQFIDIAKALSDENRVRAIMALAGGELCLCQIIELLALAPSTVSRHMAILHQAGLVNMRKKGRWIYYALARGRTANSAAATAAVDLVQRCLGGESGVKKDARTLARVRRMKVEKLCECYHRKGAGE